MAAARTVWRSRRITSRHRLSASPVRNRTPSSAASCSRKVFEQRLRARVPEIFVEVAFDWNQFAQLDTLKIIAVPELRHGMVASAIVVPNDVEAP